MGHASLSHVSHAGRIPPLHDFRAEHSEVERKHEGIAEGQCADPGP